MTADFKPYRVIHAARDLLLLDQPVRNGEVVRLAREPYYEEICLWLTLRCSTEALFSEHGQTLTDASTTDGHGWRLSLTEHGYLRFEDHNPDISERLCVESHVPVHCAANTATAFQIGLCLSDRVCLRLFVRSATTGLISEIGGEDHLERGNLSLTPESMTIGVDSGGGHAFRGAIEHLTAYNTERLELFDGPPSPSAYEALPLIPGGSSFMPRWTDATTLEVFSRPEFADTQSYWIYLDLNHLPDACRRLRLWTKWRATSMTPRFFWSADGRQWRGVVPARMAMREGDGRNFRVDFDVAELPQKGGYLASCPPFTTALRAELLAWAGTQPGVRVMPIGQSVEGRPLHVIRIGRGEDGPGRAGVAMTCGQHSPLEIMGGHVIRPVLERLLAQPTLLERCNFYFVPTVNVDCQYYGGNGLNANKRNTNRCWFSKDFQPETQACVAYFDRLKALGQRLEFAVDIHGGGTFRNHLLFTMAGSESMPLSEEAATQQHQWCGLLEKHAGLRSVESRPMRQQELRATDYFHQIHDATAFCLELSTCSYYDPLQRQTRPFEQDAFAILAEGLVRAWSEGLGA